jgi:hypothetical protein
MTAVFVGMGSSVVDSFQKYAVNSIGEVLEAFLVEIAGADVGVIACAEKSL